MTFDKHFFEYARKLYELRNTPEHRRVFAELYWRGFLMAVGVLIMLCFLYAAWQLGTVIYSLDTDAETAPHVVSSLINKGQLESTIQEFEARTSRFDAFKTTPSAAVSDPS